MTRGGAIQEAVRIHWHGWSRDFRLSLILDIKAIADGAGDSMPENPEDLEQPAA